MQNRADQTNKQIFSAFLTQQTIPQELVCYVARTTFRTTFASSNQHAFLIQSIDRLETRSVACECRYNHNESMKENRLA